MWFGFYNDIDYPIPECIIKENDFEIKFLKEFKSDLTIGWTTPNLSITNREDKYIGSYDELYKELLFELKKHYVKEKSSLSFNKYVAEKLEGKDLDKILLNYIDIVDEKHKKPKSILNIFKRK